MPPIESRKAKSVDSLCTVYQLNKSKQFLTILNSQDNILWVQREKRRATRTIREELEIIKLPRKNGDFWEGAEGGTPIGINLRKDSPENKAPEVIDYCY